MKILLQDTETKLYLSRGGSWTKDAGAALAFLDEVRAHDYSVYHRLPHTQVFTLAETVAATPATANQTSPNAESIMKTGNYTDQTNKAFRRNDDELNSIAESLVKNQVSEITQPKKGGKTTAAKKQRGSAPKPVEQTTMVVAKIDIGFGNTLFIRGRGAELSWDKGLPLKCIDGSTWAWSTTQAKDKVVFKLLLNDQVWARGDDIVVEPGKKVETAPGF